MIRGFDSCGDNYGDQNIIPNGLNEGSWSYGLLSGGSLHVVDGRGGGKGIQIDPGFGAFETLGKVLDADTSDLTIGDAIYVHSLGDRPLISTKCASGRQITLYLTSSGGLVVRRGMVIGSVLGTTIWSSSPGIVRASDWVHLGLRVLHKSDATGVVSVWRNGNLLHTVTAVVTDAYGIESCDSFEVYGNLDVHDDVYYLDPTGTVHTSFLGDRSVIYTLTDGDGPDTDFSIGGSAPAATRWQSVNGSTPYHTTKFVKATAVDQVNTFNFPAPPVNVAQVDAVMVLASMSSDDGGGSPQMTAVVTDGASPQVNASPVIVSVSPQFYGWLYEKNPIGASAWSLGDFPIGAGLKRTV